MAKGKTAARGVDQDGTLTNVDVFDDPRFVKIVQLLLTGKDYAEVAAELGITPAGLWNLRKRYRIDEWIASLNADTIDATRSAYLTAHKLAFQRLVEMLSSKSKVQQKWAIDRLLAMRAAQPAPAPSAQLPASAPRPSALQASDRAELVASARAELDAAGAKQ